MKASDDLFLLIRSLTKSEKRYFKLYAARHKKKSLNNYVKLFDAIDKQEEYNEEKLIRQFRNDTFIRNIPSTKYLLYNLILKSLYAYHSGKSPGAELGEMVETIKILYNRGLYDQCRKLLSKAKTLAEKNDQHFQFLELLGLERNFSFNWQTKNIAKTLGEIQEDQKRTIDKINNEAEFADLHTQIVGLRKVQMRVRTPEESERVREIMAHPLLQNIDQATTFYAQISYYRIHGTYGVLTADNDIAYRNFSSLVELWEANSDRINDRLHSYKSDLTNYLNACFSKEEFSQIENTLEKIKKVPAMSRDDEIKTFQDISHIELLFHLHVGLSEKADDVIGKIENGLYKYKDYLSNSRVMTFYCNLSIYYFLNAHYEKSLEWLQKILSLSNVDIRQDIQNLARILVIIIHYELGNLDVLEYLLRSAYRYLHRKNKLYDFERTILFFLNKILELGDQRAKVDLFRQLGEELKLISQSYPEKNLFGMTEIRFWVESKIRNESIKTVFMEKIHQRAVAGI